MKADTIGNLKGNGKNEDDTGGYIHYHDEGCSRAKEIGYDGPCLECIIEPCLEDTHIHVGKIRRNREIRRRRRNGESVEELAASYNVCIRTIRRVLKETG